MFCIRFYTATQLIFFSAFIFATSNNSNRNIEKADISSFDLSRAECHHATRDKPCLFFHHAPSMDPDINKQVAIFWDSENCGFSSHFSGYDVVRRIRDIAHDFGSIKLFKAYTQLSIEQGTAANLSTAPSPRSIAIAMRSELQCSGVSITDCPHSGYKNVVDQMIITDMLTFAMDNPARPPSTTIMILSGDRDFTYTLSILRMRRYKVVIVAPSNVHPSLREQASEFFEWSGSVLSRVHERETSQFGRALSSRTLTATGSDTSANIQTMYNANSSAALPTPPGSIPPPPRLPTTGSLSMNRTESGAPTQNSNKISSRSPGVLTDQKPTMQAGPPPEVPASTPDFAPAPVWKSRHQYPPAYQPSSSVDSRSPPPQGSLAFGKLTSAVDDNVSSQLEEEDRQRDAPVPAAPVVPFPLLSLRSRSPEPISARSSEVLMSSGDVPVPLPASADTRRWVPKASASPYVQERDTNGFSPHAGPSSGAAGNSSESWVPSLRKPDSSFDSRSTPLERPTSQSVPPGPFSIPEPYQSLVQQLERLRLNGILYPLRSQVALNLVHRDQQVYKQAGHTRFKEFAAEAEKRELVVLGGKDGTAWIRLRRELYGSIEVD
ncbi:hypothetical protein D9757_008743 [Collybiopsis confluens]|uniref:NYN domain-containing protein n=1 Tax=Collybiopsis confluens TaxID=2823264 RepID=A0A8H5H8Y0_9AGAR|nr:hypothetical protein D9757_008743 [Collybiopsis confluens]